VSARHCWSEFVNNDLDPKDGELVGKLRRLDATARETVPGFDYQGLLDRHAAGRKRARRRRSLALGAAGALVLAMAGLSAWRLDPGDELLAPVPSVVSETSSPQPRLVRADTYLALAAIEEHIATIDDALSDARVAAPRGAEVARLERTRADLLDSYAQVRYAEMVSANF
jgi:hypothetical protein